jgi:hypothetical protein
MQSSTEAPQKLKRELPYNPTVPFLAIYPNECKSGFNKDTCTPIFIVALSILTKLWKLSRCPTTDKWIKKMWCIHTME